MAKVALCYYENVDQIEKLIEQHPEFGSYRRFRQEEAAQIIDRIVQNSIDFQKLIDDSFLLTGRTEDDDAIATTADQWKQMVRLHHWQSSFEMMMTSRHDILFLAPVVYRNMTIPGGPSTVVPESPDGPDAYLPNAVSLMSVSTLINLRGEEIDVMSMAGPR